MTASANTMPRILVDTPATRRPVTLVYAEWFERISDAIAAERQVKSWSRAKKEALIRGDFAGLQELARRRQPFKKTPDPTS
jgi:putative endonuclease